uniref:Cytoplasmic 60S subunit biogenesis factor REI1 homolog 1 n=1 Tax=Rhizophora mucronata TaxID=61149 RepID=A0A2P2KF61_RHIMU
MKGRAVGGRSGSKKKERGKMPGLTCNACNKELKDDAEQKLHYKSDWHRYNLKRKVAGVPGVTEALFLARQSVLSQEKDKSDDSPTLYSCAVCGKGYHSVKAHAQHLKSRTHIMRASQGRNPEEEKAIIKKLSPLVMNKHPPQKEANYEESEESEGEWEEFDPEEELFGEAVKSLSDLNVNGMASNDDMDEDEYDDLLDPSCCFMCDQKHKSIESCMVHMHKQHGFFIPDIEYLKDPKGLLTYLGLKVPDIYPLSARLLQF